jgi:hypothetical protein
LLNDTLGVAVIYHDRTPSKELVPVHPLLGYVDGFRGF